MCHAFYVPCILCTMYSTSQIISHHISISSSSRCASSHLRYAIRYTRVLYVLLVPPFQCATIVNALASMVRSSSPAETLLKSRVDATGATRCTTRCAMCITECLVSRNSAYFADTACFHASLGRCTYTGVTPPPMFKLRECYPTDDKLYKAFKGRSTKGTASVVGNISSYVVAWYEHHVLKLYEVRRNCTWQLSNSLLLTPDFSCDFSCLPPAARCTWYVVHLPLITITTGREAVGEVP
jgi:hypothetical protein